MSVMALFRRSQSQSLIKAPSADLIEPDTAPKLPEMVEIECKLTPEELAKYSTAINNTNFLNVGLEIECLCHLLKKLGYKQYDKEGLSDFVKRTEHYNAQKKGQRKPNFYTSENGWSYIDFPKFIPPRIIKKICEVRSNFVNPYNLKFTIRGFSTYHFTTQATTKLKILFLEVRVDRDNQESLIIDAWRGPTFSDEEAKI